MSYYIAPQSKTLMVGDIVVYRVVKRLKDFKAEDGKMYRVFKSKQEMNNSMVVPIYYGVRGKLKKAKSEFVMRF
tara:strand:- start:15 stop:236 length:222 start_codon:yes stop_codon:yes gene_type:complete